MRPKYIPYFRAKDKDSEQWVEGFYAEFPETKNPNVENRLVPAIVLVTPSMFNNNNTLNYCTIDISTLEQIGEIEIASPIYKADSYVKPMGSGIIL